MTVYSYPPSGQYRDVVMTIVLFTLVAALSVWQSPAHGYIDPGSGSAIMSAIIGFFVAAGMIIKTYWYKLKSLFSSNKVSEAGSASADAADSQNP